jgi:hypothetical protein
VTAASRFLMPGDPVVLAMPGLGPASIIKRTLFKSWIARSADVLPGLCNHHAANDEEKS